MFGVDKDAPYAGQVFQYSSGWTLCKARFKLTSVGTVSGKTLTARVYALDGSGDIVTGSPLSTSDSVTGDNAWNNTDVMFTFSTPSTQSANTDYAVVVTVSGGTDTSNYVNTYQNNSGSLTGHGVAFFSSGVSFDLGATDDCACALYWY